MTKTGSGEMNLDYKQTDKGQVASYRGKGSWTVSSSLLLRQWPLERAGMKGRQAQIDSGH